MYSHAVETDHCNRTYFGFLLFYIFLKLFWLLRSVLVIKTFYRVCIESYKPRRTYVSGSARHRRGCGSCTAEGARPPDRPLLSHTFVPAHRAHRMCYDWNDWYYMKYENIFTHWFFVIFSNSLQKH